MTPMEFEPTVPAGEWPQTYALRPRGHWDRLAVMSEEPKYRVQEKYIKRKNDVH